MPKLATACLAALVLTAGCQIASPSHAPQAPNPQKVEVDFYPIVAAKDSPEKLPGTFHLFFGVLAHSNGKVYIGTNYHVGRLVEFDPASKQFRVVAAMSSQAINGGGPTLANPTLKGDLGPDEFPGNRWVHAQDKIHAQLHEGKDGRVYGATHVKVEDADSTRAYPGGHWFAYDPRTGATEDLGWARRHEGIITCCMDVERNVLYGVSWPTGYLFMCKPGEKEYPKRLRILGLTSSAIDCSPRYVDVVKDGRVYAQDGATGDILIYDPAVDRLVRIAGLAVPPGPLFGGKGVDGTLRGSGRWRNWWILGVKSPDGMHLFTTPQRSGHLTEIDATQGKWGVVIDHGRTVPWARDEWSGPWCGIMVFGPDGLLYHTVGQQLLTFDRATGRVFDLGGTALRGKPDVTVSLGGGGALGRDGRIYAFASVDGKPGIAVLDAKPLDAKTAVLLRISPRNVIRPQSADTGD